MDAVKSFAIKHLKEGAIYAVLFILLAIIVIQEPSFLSLRNLSNILTQSSVRVIIALGGSRFDRDPRHRLIGRSPSGSGRGDFRYFVAING